MAGATFHYRAVAADGKLRTGVITAESTRLVARELMRQGLTPLYVGEGEKKTHSLWEWVLVHYVLDWPKSLSTTRAPTGTRLTATAAADETSGGAVHNHL